MNMFCTTALFNQLYKHDSTLPWIKWICFILSLTNILSTTVHHSKSIFLVLYLTNNISTTVTQSKWIYLVLRLTNYISMTVAQSKWVFSVLCLTNDTSTTVSRSKWICLVQCLANNKQMWCWVRNIPWWRYQMETFSALLALGLGNLLVTGEFPSQRPMTRCFDAFFDMHLNKRLNKQS